jgi:hypothetical protein
MMADRYDVMFQKTHVPICPQVFENYVECAIFKDVDNVVLEREIRFKQSIPIFKAGV